jgi:hypothetical protein
MYVVDTLKVAKSGSPDVTKRNLADARMVSCTIDPHGIDEGTVPLHCQFSVLPTKVAPMFGPPAPNCTLTPLLTNDQFVGVNIHEMFPATWNLRSTGGRPPAGDVMLTKSCGDGMTSS